MTTSETIKNDYDDVVNQLDLWSRDLAVAINDMWEWLVQLGLAIEEKQKK